MKPASWRLNDRDGAPCRSDAQYVTCKCAPLRRSIPAARATSSRPDNHSLEASCLIIAVNLPRPIAWEPAEGCKARKPLEWIFRYCRLRAKSASQHRQGHLQCARRTSLLIDATNGYPYVFERIFPDQRAPPQSMNIDAGRFARLARRIAERADPGHAGVRG